MPICSHIANRQLQMQELHPRFLFHEGNWLIKHLTISHLTNMNRKFCRMEPDPDRAVYQAYLANGATPQFPTSIQGPTSKSLYNVCPSLRSLHLVMMMLSLPSQEAAASSPLASKKTNTSGCILPSSNNATTSSRVPPVPAITARPEQVRAVELSSVSPTFLYCPKLGNVCVPFQDLDRKSVV